MVYLIYVDCFSIYHRVDRKFPRTDYPLRWLKNNEDNRYVQRSTILHKNLQMVETKNTTLMVNGSQTIPQSVDFFENNQQYKIDIHVCHPFVSVI